MKSEPELLRKKRFIVTHHEDIVIQNSETIIIYTVTRNYASNHLDAGRKQSSICFFFHRTNSIIYLERDMTHDSCDPIMGQSD